MHELYHRMAVVREARTWVGTPFGHQKRLKGVAVDCIGLILGTGVDADVLHIDREKMKPYTRYSRTPNPTFMRRGLETFFAEIPEQEAKVGDVAWFQWRQGLPMHVGIFAELKGKATIIHCVSDVGRVVEHDFTTEWSERVNSWWRFPRLAGLPGKWRL